MPEMFCLDIFEVPVFHTSVKKYEICLQNSCMEEFRRNRHLFLLLQGADFGAFNEFCFCLFHFFFHPYFFSLGN